MDVYEWIEKQEDRKPKIDEFRDDIFLLKEKNFTNKDVKRYLEEVHNYKVTEAYIGKYIRKIRGGTNEKKEKKTQTVSKDEKSDTQEQTKQAKLDEFFHKNNKGR